VYQNIYGLSSCGIIGKSFSRKGFFVGRQKLGNREQDSILIQNLPNGVAVEFERTEVTRRLRLILSEVLFIMSQVGP
jgi:hypothetical protein